MKIPARVRLTLFYTAIFTGLLLLSSIFIYYRVSRNLHKDFRQEIIHDGRIIAELFKEELRLNALDEFAEESKEFGFDLEILDQQRKPVVQSDEWTKIGAVIDEETFAALREAPVFREVTLNGKPYALFSRSIHIPLHGAYTLHMVRSQETLKKTLGTLLEWMLIIKSFMVLLAALLGYLFAARTLRADERAYERLKNFTADASHELRIPLTSLRGNIEVALRKERTPREYQETLRNALEDAEHLSTLTGDLLLLAQNDAGQLKVNIQSVNLKDFMENVFAQVQAFPDAKKIRKVLLPTPEATVRFDPDRINQLLLNLVDNAVKYGVPNGELSLGAELAGGKLKLIVRDTGIGIAQEEQEKIFGRFYRVDKVRSREQSGTGLGLSIVQWIVRAHEGSIHVESQEGKGSTFTVTLPVKSA